MLVDKALCEAMHLNIIPIIQLLIILQHSNVEDFQVVMNAVVIRADYIAAAVALRLQDSILPMRGQSSHGK